MDDPAHRDICQFRAERLAEMLRQAEESATRGGPDTLWNKQAIEAIHTIMEAYKLVGAERELVEAAVDLADAFAAMQIYPLLREIARLKRSQRGLRKGSHKDYGSEEEMNAAIAERVRLRDEILANDPSIKKGCLHKEIAKRAKSPVKGVKTIQRTLRDWDRRQQSQGQAAACHKQSDVCPTQSSPKP